MKRSNLRLASAGVVGGLALMIMSVAVTTSSAAIIALRADDSVGGFTTSTPDLPDTFSHENPDINDNDNEWGHASDPGHLLSQLGDDDPETANLVNYIWISRADTGNVGEDNRVVNVTLDGLDDTKSYNLYMYQATNTNSDWSLQAGIGALSGTYTQGDGVVLDTEGPRLLERVSLGSVSGVTSALIVLDDVWSASGGERGFIKGVGVEEVPEPNSFVLISLAGVFAVALRRKRKLNERERAALS